MDPSFRKTYPAHSVTALGFLVGLERNRIVPDDQAVFQAMRTNGRESVRAVTLDRRDRAFRDGEDTTWRP